MATQPAAAPQPPQEEIKPTPQTAQPTQADFDLAAKSGVAKEDYQKELERTQQLGIQVNPDALIGNILMQRPQTPVVDSTSARAKLQQTGTEIDQAETFLSGQQPQAPEVAGAPPRPSEIEAFKVGQSGLMASQEAVIQKGLEANQANFSALEADIRAQVEEEKRAATEAQRIERGAATSQLARMGALIVSSSGTQYLNDLQVRHQDRINVIVSAGFRAIQQARAAKTDADFKVLNEQMEMIRDNRAQVQKERDDYFKEIKTFAEIQKIQRDDVFQTIDAIAQSGLEDVPDDYLSRLDKNSRLPSGWSKSFLELSRKQYKRAEELEESKAALEEAKTLQSLLASTPIGVPVEIDGFRYYGTKGAGEIEVDYLGVARSIVVDQKTGVPKVVTIGNVGTKDDGWVTQNTSDGLFFVNTRTQEAIPATMATDWQDDFPEGSYGGQCGRFVNELTGLGVGDTIESKIAKTDPSIGTPQNPVRVGDAIVTTEGGWTGHIAIVSDIRRVNGKEVYRLMESNYNRDEKITHSRTLTAGDPRIAGFAHPVKTDPRLQTGSDRIIGREKKETQGNIVYRDGRQVVVKPMSSTERMNLRKEIKADPVIKDYNELQSVHSKMNKLYASSLENPQASKASLDQAMVTLFNKMLDPTSVVREGEYARTAEGQSVIDRAAGYVERLQKGGAGVTDQTRQEMVEVAKILLGSAQDAYETTLGFYVPIIEDAGEDPERFIQGYDQYLKLNEGTETETTQNFEADSQFILNEVKNNPALKEEAINAMIEDYPDREAEIRALFGGGQTSRRVDNVKSSFKTFG